MRRLAAIATLLAAAVVLAVVGTGSSSGKQKIYYVRAIFDNAAFAVPGEDVRIAGAPVGSIHVARRLHIRVRRRARRPRPRTRQP